MIFKKFGIFLALVVGSFAVANGDCPCSVDAGSLTCQPGIISEFPEDVFKVNQKYSAVFPNLFGLRHPLRGSKTFW